jgi:uncharacterized membrane protein YfhO
MKRFVRNHPALTLLVLISVIVVLSLLPLCLINGYDCYFDDFVCQQIPFLLETKRLLASGTPWWSWNTFFGENFIASYSFYTVTSPFAWIIALFPQHSILIGIAFAFWLKCLAVGYVAYLYLKRMDFSHSYCIVGGLLYCFSSFFITNLRYYHFCEPMILFPLLLIAIENVIAHRKYGYTQLALASFGVTWINYYFALPSFLFAAVYMLFRMYAVGNGDKGQAHFQCLAKSCGAVLIGILMSGVVLVPTFVHVSGTSRATASVLGAWIHLGITGNISQFRTLMTPSLAEGTPVAFIPTDCSSRSLYLPVLGLLVVILFLFSLQCKQMKWLKYFIGLCFITAFTPLNGIFSGYSNVYYHRWFYALSLMLILSSLYYLRKQKIPRRIFWYYTICIVAMMLGLTVLRLCMKHCLTTRAELELLLTGLNLWLLGMFVYSEQKVRYLICVVFVSAATSLGGSLYLNLLSGDVQEPTSGRIWKYVVDNPLPYNAEPFQYRTDTNNSIRNLALLKNRPGVTSFHSVFDKNQTDYRAVIDSSCVSVTLYVSQGRVSHDILLSVKEFYDYREDEHVLREQHLPIETLTLTDSLARYSRYAFNYYVPMGFCYDSYMTRSSYDSLYLGLEDPVKPMLVNLVIEDSDVEALRKVMRPGIVANTDTLSFDSIVANLRAHTATSFSGNTHGFEATTDLDSTRVMFFSVSPDPGFSATIDGAPTKIYRANLGFSAIIVPAGKHHINFDYLPVGLKLGGVCSLVACLFCALLCYKESKENNGLTTV